MKKIIIVSLLILLVPIVTLAYFKPATLTDGISKVAVYSETQAKSLFSKGYWLDGANKCDDCTGALTGPDIESRYLSVNGDRTFHIYQAFQDATTTIVAFVNPFGLYATSTVDMVRLTNTGAATTTYGIYCGAATTVYADPTYNLASSTEIATTINFGTIENNLTAALNGNSIGYDGGSVAKITLTPNYPYFVCKVRYAGATGAFTEATNTFAGKAMVRISQTR